MSGACKGAHIGVLFILLAPAAAHAQTEVQCLAYYKKKTSAMLEKDRPTHTDSTKLCQAVAGLIWGNSKIVKDAADIILTPEGRNVASIFSQRDLQSHKTQDASTAGSAAQGQAIPSIQPAGVAAGTIAAVGTKKGDEAIAALSVNPFVLFVGNVASQQLARTSRLADFTVFLPMNQSDTAKAKATSDTKLKYVGARMRLNLLGRNAGDQVWKGADSLLADWIAKAGSAVSRIPALLAKAPDFEGCADALLDDKADAVTKACGSPFSFGVDLEAAGRLKSELRKVADAADAQYFGADLRADFGDPTLGVIPNASGTSWSAGLAAGKRFTDVNQEGATFGIRARLGMRYAKLDSVAAAEYAGEGGLGVEMSRNVDQQEINASAAVEFRYGNAPSIATEQFQTNFVMLRGSLLLPVFGSNGVSINVGIPITGPISPIMSVNFNWGLLLPDSKLK